MKSYDKATWHIDGGEKKAEVVARFRKVFEFLDEKKMLSEDGRETFEFGMDSSVVLNTTMVNAEGQAFLDGYYDWVLQQNPQEVKKNLSIAYDQFLGRE